MGTCYILHPNLRPQGGGNNEETPDTVNLVSLGVPQPSMQANEFAVHDNYKVFCVKASVLSLGRAQRTILLLRDSGALQSVASQGQLYQGRFIHSFIHIEHLYSASSRKLLRSAQLLRSAYCGRCATISHHSYGRSSSD